MGRHGTSIAGAQLVQSCPSVGTPRVVVGNALREEQPLQSVDMPNPFADERLQFTAEAPLVLFVWCRHANHGADARLAALVGQQGADQSLSINSVCLSAAMPAGDGNRGGIDDVALDLF